MSNVFYPLSLIDKLVPSKIDRTVADPFEAGTTFTRRTWPAQFFKRQFQLTHAPLTLAEFGYLRSFFSQRNGLYDSFWFRDNVHRDGNASVRFTTALAPTFSGSARLVTVNFDEVAPIRALPEFDEVTAAAGVAPALWYDANRELYYIHAGAAAVTDPQTYDAMLKYRASWQGGTALNLGGVLSQYQTYDFAASQWAKTAGNVTELAAGQPACTLFAIAKQAASAVDQVLFAVGNHGIMLSAANYYQPYISSLPGWATAKSLNNPASTFRSVAVVWTGGSNNTTLYVNATAIATEAQARAFVQGSASLGALPDGSRLTTGSVAHAIAFPGALTAGQVAAVHDLLGYQFGLPVV